MAVLMVMACLVILVESCQEMPGLWRKRQMFWCNPISVDGDVPAWHYGSTIWNASRPWLEIALK